MDYTFWLGKDAPKVEYDVIPCPPDYIMVEKRPRITPWCDVDEPFDDEAGE